MRVARIGRDHLSCGQANAHRLAAGGRGPAVPAGPLQHARSPGARPRPGEAVLDLAAAPGGKTLHLAARMRLEGELAAVEPVRDRFFKLQANLARCGAGEFVRTFSHDGRDVGRKTPDRFDAVLLDAPCSSEARFDPRRPQSFAYWGPRKLAESARKQKALLRSAVDAARPGGRVLYCTCSFAPEENELVVAHTLRRMAGRVELRPLGPALRCFRAGLVEWEGKTLPSELAHTVRVAPDRRMAGFYLALLEKRAASRPTPAGRAEQRRRRG
ncbi:RsmB/NOP family class I SAM-dependent RNA methyltransferase [Botrimarina sp.]|uniref:RsmB/NOP family class I SAM-dependent RNA methyltransferase n=1 Tax=Botrimarina sp. TaxID=2795802 RepID=UPI0032ED1403